MSDLRAPNQVKDGHSQPPARMGFLWERVPYFNAVLIEADLSTTGDPLCSGGYNCSMEEKPTLQPPEATPLGAKPKASGVSGRIWWSWVAIIVVCLLILSMLLAMRGYFAWPTHPWR